MQDDLIKHFGKPGKFFYNIVRGIDNREVQPEREIKSVGAEDTFSYDLTNVEEMNTELDKIAVLVHNRLMRYELKGRTITLKIKYHDFKLITRSQSFIYPTNEIETIADTSKILLSHADIIGKKIRLLGITVSNFGDAPAKDRKRDNPAQLKLF